MGPTLAVIAAVLGLTAIRVALVFLSRPKPKYDFQKTKHNDAEPDKATVIRLDPGSDTKDTTHADP